jgi:hypothetical protein
LKAVEENAEESNEPINEIQNTISDRNAYPEITRGDEKTRAKKDCKRRKAVKDGHCHFTRNGDNLSVMLCKSKTTQLSAEYMGIQIFNKLPINIKYA